MKNLAKYSVHKPITVLMSILIIVLLGIISLTKLPLELFPNINLPYAVVVTTDQGKNPYEVESDVTKPIEQNLLTVSNIKSIQSTSRANFSIVIAEFQQSTNMDSAFLEMRENFEMLNLKDGVGNPMIIKFDPDMMPVMVVSISRDWGKDVSDDQALIKTTEWVNTDLLNKLERIPGVASVSLNGASDTQIQISLDQTQLAKYGLSQEEVMNIVKNQNIEGIAGIVPDQGNLRMLYIGDKVKGLDGLKQTPVTFDNTTNKIITLNDLSSDISFVNANDNQYMKINGKQGISIAFQKQSDVGITEVVKSIQKTLNEITDNPSNHAQYVELLNQGDYIQQSVGSVTNNLIIGSILAIFVLFIFLRDIRPTLIVGLAIPISVIGAFALMYAFNISLNIVSMGGLALGIGMLVDNSIVVIENIYRLLSEGKSAKEAAIVGASQVAGAITASTVTTIAVFLPIVFIEGMTAEIFTAMALTVTFSLVASLVIALTMVPSLGSRSLRKTNVKTDRVTLKLQSWYEKAARFALKRKALTMLVVTLLFVLSIFFASKQGFEMMPPTDEGTITINVNMQKGTDFEKTAELTDALTKQIMGLSDLKTVSAQIGSSGMLSLFGGSGSSDQSTITVLLKDDRKLTTAEVADKIETMEQNLNYSQFTDVAQTDVSKITVSAQSTTSMSGLGGNGIQILIKGNDLDSMKNVADQLVTQIQEVKGTKDVDNGVTPADDIVRVTVNKENAIMRNITEQDIQQAISNFYTSLGASMSTEVDTSMLVQVNGVDYELSVPTTDFSAFSQITYNQLLGLINVFDDQVTQAITNKLDENPNFKLYTTDKTYGYVINPDIHYDATLNRIYLSSDDDTNPTLQSLAKGRVYEGNQDTSMTTVEKLPGYGTINRDGKSRTLTVSAKIEDGYSISKLSSKVEDKVNQYLNSDEYKNAFGQSGISVSFVGENQDIQQTTHDMLIAAVAAILLVYMIMAIQFQSLKYPFIVLFTIPLAFTGGLLSIIITGQPISMVAMVGLVILSGIVVNNGIVLITYLNQLREEGMPIEEAIIQAGKTRLRPIFMTALTTILALIPMAIGFGDGGELLQPLGITAIGGLIYATLLTLLVAPVMYRILNRKNKK